MRAVAGRVAAGAAFLDEHEPGWEVHIDLAKLDIDSVCTCVLGQLHLTYDQGRRLLRVPGLGVALGFHPSRGNDDDSDKLTAEWERVINDRRTPVAA